MILELEEHKISVIGLGYVGLPLAIELGKKYETIGFDINPNRIDQLILGLDSTNELTKNKNVEKKIITTKGRNFVIENFYSGVARFKFNDLCDRNLGAEDYINIANDCNHIFIEEVPKFNNENSNQQLRFITLVDIFYEKKIRLTLSLEENFENLSSSNKHSEIFKRTVSRLFEMTKCL